MHKIDRYGVIALVFMAVTFLAVYFWDERSKPASKKEPKRGNDQAKVEPRPTGKPPAPEHSLAKAPRTNDLPLSANDASKERPTADRPGGERNPGGKTASVPRPLPATLGDLNAKDAESNTAPGESSAPVSSEPAKVSEGKREPTKDLEELIAPSKKATKAREGEVVPAAATPEAEGRSYTVAAGDTLERIARRELGDGARWAEIQALNDGIDPKKLWVGRKLRLPQTGAAVASATGSPAPAAKTVAKAKPEGARSYVVKKGEILGGIAQRELGTTKAIGRVLALNPGLNPDRLLAGTTIYLPADSGTKPGLPLELAKSSSKRVAQVDNKNQGSFKVR